MRKIVLTAMAMVLLSGMNGLRAQDKAMAKPELLKKIMAWKGDWEAKLTSKMGEQTTTGVDHASFALTSDGNGVTMKQWMDTPKGGKYQATHLIGYNSEDKKVHWFIVDNMGGCQDQMVELVSDNHIRISYNGTKDGKPMQQTADLMLKDNNTVDFNQVFIVDGKTAQSMAGTYKRKMSK